MTILQHLVTILGEEGVEVAQRATKALRFGMEEVQPGQPMDNAARIMEEAAHVVAAYEMLQEGGHLPAINRGMVEAKKGKVFQFLQYSWQQGQLELPDCPQCGRPLTWDEGGPELLRCGVCRESFNTVAS